MLLEHIWEREREREREREKGIQTGSITNQKSKYNEITGNWMKSPTVNDNQILIFSIKHQKHKKLFSNQSQIYLLKPKNYRIKIVN